MSTTQQKERKIKPNGWQDKEMTAFSATLTPVSSAPKPDSTLAPGQAQFTKVLAPNEAQLSPVYKEAIGPIRIGTTASSSFMEAHRLNDKNPVKIKATQAFTDLKTALKAGYPNVMNMTVDTDTALVTLTMKNRDEVVLTVGEVKALIKKTHPNPKLVDEEVEGYFLAFSAASRKAGLTAIPYYSAKDPDKLGSTLGGQALEVTKESHALIQHSHVTSLFADQSKKKEIYRSANSLISKAGDVAAQKEAVKKILKIEAATVALETAVEEKTKALTTEYKASPSEPKRATLRNFNLFQEKLRRLNREAIWAATLYPKSGECYEEMLIRYYELYASQFNDPSQVPGFIEFTRSAESRPFRQHAAEIASMLISNPKEYRLFCAKHEIPPKDLHFNRFFINALQGTYKFEDLGISLPAKEEAELKDLTQKAIDSADALDPMIKRLEKPNQTPTNLLESAIYDKEVATLIQTPSFWQRTVQTIKELSPF
jgi:hypothetical protein